MISEERYEELNSIATEIFEALACERYEPSERGAGWAPTDKGYQDVVHILSRAKAVMWDRESPAERRKAAIFIRKQQQRKAKEIADRLLGINRKPGAYSICLHCKSMIRLRKDMTWSHSSNGNRVCGARAKAGHHEHNHEPRNDN
jgi:hypothetical protein